MAPRIQIAPGLQLAACIARSHRPADSPSRPGILADRVNSVAIISGSNTLRLPGHVAMGRLGTRHGDRMRMRSNETFIRTTRVNRGG
jgi:hypothetical protein